jgi:hypothetical protein
MLEAAVVLEMVLGKYVEGSIIATLLVFNAALGKRGVLPTRLSAVDEVGTTDVLWSRVVRQLTLVCSIPYKG